MKSQVNLKNTKKVKVLDNPDIQVLSKKELKVYERTLESYLKDSNAYGNIYFSRYFDWQGIVRESFFIERICSDMLGCGIKLITKKAFIEYIQEVFPFQKIRAVLNTRNLRNASGDIDIFFLTKMAN